MSLHLTIKSSIPKDSSNATFYDNLDIEFSGSSTLEEKFWIGKKVENNKDNWPYIDDENTTLGKYDPHYYINLVELNFDKQMYRPGEITARIQIRRKEFSKKETKAEASRTMFHLLSLAELTGYFMNCEVELKNKDETKINTIAEKYIVKELTPEYTSEQKSIYINLKMYSPDIALTGKIENAVNVAKQLGEEILKDKCETAGISVPSIIPQNKLAHHTYKEVTRGSETKQAITSTDEYIHPYLVQYNESFYDMLIRTANRWGEFVYYEDGKLVLGLNSSEADDITTYKSISYINDNPHDSVADVNAKAAVVSDDYLEVIKKSHKPEWDKVRRGKYKDREGHEYNDQEEGNQYILQAGDMYAMDDVYWHKFFQSILNMKGNVFDWLVSSNLDEGITAAQNEFILYRLEKEYNNHFFNNPLNETDTTKLARIKKHYSDETNPEKCCQFAYYTGDTDTGGLTKSAYKDVLDKEITAGQNMLSIDLGATYTHLRLGNEFKFSGDTDNTYYLVTGVKCITEKNKEGKNELHFFVTAIKNTQEETKYNPENASEDTKYRVYYPPMLPSGHVRFSGPQRGYIQDTLDPMLNGRYRVFFAWQNGTGDSSPWLRVSREMTKKGCGGVWQLDKDTEVLLDFQDGNVELPYIVGTLQETGKRSSARSNMFNNLDLTTPAGHAIRLSDGYGAGSANFIASFIPLVGMIKGFTPDLAKSNFKEGNDRYYDGGMELTDRYGIYSIKASTDKRNITINSPFGDVNLNAFTGITISAPNGDVKIQGKNVSIEAGNNLTIKSGENIKNGFWGGNSLKSLSMSNLGTDIIKAAASKAISYFDLSILRHTLEIFLRPIEGTLEIKSHRFLKLEAGPGEADIPVSGYTLEEAKKIQEKTEVSTGKIILKTFEQISPIVEGIIYAFFTKLNTCWAKMDAYARHLTDNAFTDADCISADDLVSKIANAPNTALKIADFNFKGKLSTKDEDINALARQELIDQHLNHFSGPAYNQLLTERAAGIKRPREQKQTEIIELAETWRAHVLAFKIFIDMPYTVAPNPQIDTDKLQAAVREVCKNDKELGVDALFDKASTHFVDIINIRDRDVVSGWDWSDTLKGKYKRVIAKKLLEKYDDIEEQLDPVTNNDVVEKTQAWTNYVNSLVIKQDNINGAEKSNKLTNQLVNKLIDNINFLKNVRDDKVWGDESRGKILFSSGPTTQVLEEDIHQAETFFSAHSSLHPDSDITGHTDRVRNILSSL